MFPICQEAKQKAAATAGEAAFVGGGHLKAALSTAE